MKDSLKQTLAKIIEIYSDEETNSCNRYKDFDSWCSGFYIPMVEKACEVSKVFILKPS